MNAIVKRIAVGSITTGLVLGTWACSAEPDQKPPAAVDTSDGVGTDTIQFGGDDTAVKDTGPAPTGDLWLTIDIDDTANKTFADEEIKWTGSFSWDEETNTIVYADSWLPTDGPFPFVWDDGPISAGGHEREGATKGDHIFTTAVKFVAAEDAVFQYGLLNELDNWMWIGPDGSLEVKKGATGVVAAKGMAITKHGDVDMKISLDVSKLHEKYASWADKPHKFFVKGTMNMWTPRQLLDDGNKGDEKADDGVYTYVHSKNLGSHDGLLNPGEEVQFVWVATQGDTAPEAGKEYKSGVNAHAEGVSAWAADGAGGWQSVEVIHSLDSKGKVKNTAIVIPGGCEPACSAEQECKGGKCVPKTADPCAGKCTAEQECKDGKCVDKDACGGTCTDNQECKEGKCVDADPCGGQCTDKQECKEGKCVDKTVDPCGGTCGAKQKCVDSKCVDTLWLDKVEPAKGPLVGGTKTDVLGGGFKVGAVVRFGGNAPTCALKDAGKLACTSPKGDKSGAVAVEVDNGGGDTVSKDAAFTYDPPPEPQVLLLEPIAVAAEEGEAIKGAKGRVRVAGVTTDPGQNKDVTFEFGYGPTGSLPTAKAWKWQPGTFVEEDQFGKGEETYSADFGVLPLGNYLFTVRATYAGKTVVGDSDGSENGMAPDKLGTIKVTTKDTTPKVTGIDPVWASAKGGSTMVILGKNLKTDFKVEIKSSVFPLPSTASDAAVVANGLSVKIPKGPGPMPTWPPKPASVIVTPTGAPAITLDNALHFVPIHTPTMDGKVTIEEWTTATQLGLNNASSGWANNFVKLSYAAYDKDNLYVGVQATCEALNAIVVYLDVDHGSKTGAKDPASLKDNKNSDNLVDDALSSVLTVTDTGFGIDFGFATVGMKSFDGKVLGESKDAGWRDMKNVSDFSWLSGQVVAKAGIGVEASIPLKTVFPQGVPKAGTKVAFFAAVVTKDGGKVAPGGITPNKTSDDYKGVAKELATFYVFPL